MNKPQQNSPAGNFVAMLQTKTGGVSLLELDHELAQLVRQVRETGLSGTMTLKIKISANSKRGIKISDDLAIKAPKEKQGDCYFFADESGALLRNDPNQTILPLKVLEDAPASQPKVVNA